MRTIQLTIADIFDWLQPQRETEHPRQKSVANRYYASMPTQDNGDLFIPMLAIVGLTTQL